MLDKSEKSVEAQIDRHTDDKELSMGSISGVMVRTVVARW